MKKLVLTSILLVFVIFIKAQSNVYYFDFGANDITNGVTTSNPDVNSNKWNNICSTPTITPGAAGSATSMAAAQNFPNLITSTGISTNYGLYFNATFTVNGITKGGLVTPFASQFVGNEDLAIATATQDYIFTTATTAGPSFKLTGLSTSKKYKFKIFGSRNTSALRTSQYTIQGAGTVVSGTLNTSSVAGLGGNVYYQTTGNNLPDLAYYSTTSGGSFNATSAVYYGNNSSVYYSDFVIPTAQNEITITLTTTNGGFAYINCMKMEEYDLSTAVNKTDDSPINVYPTNFDNKLLISGAKSIVELYNASGQKLISQPAVSITEMNTFDLPKGFYLLIVDKQKTYKLLKK